MYKLIVTYNHPSLPESIVETFKRGTLKDFKRMVHDIKDINKKQGITHVTYKEVIL